MKKFMVLAMAAMVMVGCTQNEDEKINGPVEIKFGAGIQVAGSRAAIESNGGKPTSPITGIQILRGTDGATPAFDVANVLLTGNLDTNGDFSDISSKQYLDEEDANFIAYYPLGTPSAGNVAYAITGQEDILATKAVAKATSAEPKVTFDFEHKLARVKLVVKATPAAIAKFGDLTEATINVPTALDLAIVADGTTTLAANATTPANKDLSFGGATLVEGSANAANELMVLPSALDKIELTFEKSALKEYTITGLRLEAGKTTTITVTVTSSITFESATIDQWIDGGDNGNVDVE